MDLKKNNFSERIVDKIIKLIKNHFEIDYLKKYSNKKIFDFKKKKMMKFFF